MTKGRNQHVVPPPDGGWAVKPEGGQRASSIHGTQRGATDRRREVSRIQHSELFVHGRDGRIRERDSHGHEPNPPMGLSLACPHGAGPPKHRNMRNDGRDERTAASFGTLSFGGRHATV
jgi:hypothetical protein